VLNLNTDLLLGLNFLVVLYLVFRHTNIQRRISNQQDLGNKWLEKNKKLIKEVTELKKAVEKSHQTLLDQLKLLQQERVIEPPQSRELPSSPRAQHLLLNDRYKEIFELKEKGLTTEQIAKELDKGYGEVAFILDLANQEHSSST
jgi:hypothetical protein